MVFKMTIIDLVCTNELRIQQINTTTFSQYGIRPGFDGYWHLTIKKNDFYQERYPYNSKKAARLAGLRILEHENK